MLFSKNKKVNLEALKTESPEVYDELMADIKKAIGFEQSAELEAAQKTIVELTQKTERETEDAKIIEYGKSLKVEEVMNQAIKDKVSFDVALIKMVDAHLKNIKDFVASFEDTASEAAGANLDDDDKTETEPKTFVEAMRFIANRDKITKAEAAEKAKKEFKTLFDEQYEDLLKLEEE